MFVGEDLFNLPFVVGAIYFLMLGGGPNESYLAQDDTLQVAFCIERRVLAQDESHMCAWGRGSNY